MRLIKHLGVSMILVGAAPFAALAAPLQPDHVVVVMMQDRFSNAIGNPIYDYLNSIAPSSLVYTNSHGVGHPSLANSAAFYSGSTQGVASNNNSYTWNFTGPNLGKAMFDAGHTFSGYVENLPSNGSQASMAGNSQWPDLYTRNMNPMAMFPQPAGQQVNKTFTAFTNIAADGDYSDLPDVSIIIPNQLHTTHGSNEAEPWAGSPDEVNNNTLRDMADNWLHDFIKPYLDWAKTHNSLLVITQDEERYVGGSASTITTLVNGDSDLFVAGTDNNFMNHYDLLHTIEQWYGLGVINPNDRGSLYFNGAGQLAPLPEPTAICVVVSALPLMVRRRKRANRQ